VKAAREAATRTSWTEPDPAYESDLRDYVRGVLACDRLVVDVAAFVARLHPGFVATCLGQRALQILLPGVPDVYQGCETVSLRLVDPDNRVQPDLDALDDLLDSALARPVDPGSDLPVAKVRLTVTGLRLRRSRPTLAHAPYQPLVAVGAASAHVVGFARGDDVAVVASRLVLGLARSGGWRDTRLRLPAGRWRELLTDTVHNADPAGTPVGALLGWPVALLVRDEG
jgi:(1->4)-alpha-D-glucan 1-alpha-D-glucosylmutase